MMGSALSSPPLAPQHTGGLVLVGLDADCAPCSAARAAQGLIKSLEQIYLFSMPVKEYQIVEYFLGPALKDEVMKIMPVQKQTRAGQRTRFKVSCARRSAEEIVACWPGLNEQEEEEEEEPGRSSSCSTELQQQQQRERTRACSVAAGGRGGLAPSRAWRSGGACGAASAAAERPPAARTRPSRARRGSLLMGSVCVWDGPARSQPAGVRVRGRLQRPRRPGRQVRQGGARLQQP